MVQGEGHREEIAQAIVGEHRGKGKVTNEKKKGSRKIPAKREGRMQDDFFVWGMRFWKGEPEESQKER